MPRAERVYLFGIQLRITVWDLETSRQYHVLSPKKGCEGGARLIDLHASCSPVLTQVNDAGWAISPSEPDYVAVLERHAGKDHIGIYELEKMSLVRVSFFILQQSRGFFDFNAYS